MKQDPRIIMDGFALKILFPLMKQNGSLQDKKDGCHHVLSYDIKRVWSRSRLILRDGASDGERLYRNLMDTDRIFTKALLIPDAILAT